MLGLRSFVPNVGLMVAWYGRRCPVLVLEVLVKIGHVSGSTWFRRSWGHLDLLPVDGGTGAECYWLYCSVPGSLQTVQRAEIWGVILAL